MMNIARFLQKGRFLLGVFVGLFLGVMCLGKAAPPKEKAPKVIRAQRFELVDEKGQVLGVMGKEKGAVTIMLSSNKTKEGLVNGGITMTAFPDGASSLILVDAKHNTVAYLQIEADGTPKLMLSGLEGKYNGLQPEYSR